MQNIDENINKRLLEINATLREPFIYINNKSKLKLKCNNDNHEWNPSYYSLINGKSKCPRCQGQIIYEYEAIERVNKRLLEINATLREPFKYIGVDKTILKLKCNVDGYEWKTKYSNFINNKTNCPKCSQKVLIKDEIYNNINNKLKEKNISLQEPFIYINNKSKLKLKCNIDNYEWETKYLNFINNNKGCAKCAGILKLTQEEVEKIVNDQCLKMNFKLNKSFEYKNTRSLILEIKCNNCNHIWNVRFNNFIYHNSGCPECNISKGEQEIEKVLKEYDINYIKQKTFKDCKYIKNLKFDFFLPELNICIEYDGIQHYEALDFFGGEIKLKENQNRDQIKNQYCIDNNIDLIRISYLNFKNIKKILSNIM
jgi:predicted Zn-ribbon and HTH transcriptional regulator